MKNLLIELHFYVVYFFDWANGKYGFGLYFFDWANGKYGFGLDQRPVSWGNNTHTHTHTYIYNNCICPINVDIHDAWQHMVVKYR